MKMDKSSAGGDAGRDMDDLAAEHAGPGLAEIAAARIPVVVRVKLPALTALAIIRRKIKIHANRGSTRKSDSPRLTEELETVPHGMSRLFL